MNLNIDPVETAHLRVICAVLALQHVAGQDAHLVRIPGTPHVIVIGTKAEAARLLDLATAAAAGAAIASSQVHPESALPIALARAYQPAASAVDVKPWHDRITEDERMHDADEVVYAMREEIGELRAQLASERAAKEYEQRHAAESEKALAEMQDQLASAREAEASARVDAERYRLLRDIDTGPWGAFIGAYNDSDDGPIWCRGELADKFVDAARAQLTTSTQG